MRELAHSIPRRRVRAPGATLRPATGCLALGLLLGGPACGGAGGAAGTSSLKTGGDKPGWITLGREARFPDGEYITAAGAAGIKGLSEADAIGRIDKAARDTLALNLAGKISTELSDYEKSQGSNGKFSNQVLIEQRSKQTVDNFDASYIAIKDRWSDGETGYGLAVLDKAKVVMLERPKLADLARSAADHVARGDALVDKDPGAALGEYFSARLDAEKAWGGKALLRLLGGEAGSIPSPAESAEKLATLIGRIDLGIESGGEQRASDGKSLARPVVVRATVGGAAVASLPLRVQMKGAQTDAGVRSGSDGRASIHVGDVGKFDAAEKALVVAIDWGAFAKGAAPAWSGSLPDKNASTVALKKTKESTRVIVKLVEQIMRKQDGTDPVTPPEPPVRAALLKALEQAGLKPKDAQELDARLGPDAAKASESDIKDKAMGLCDLIVLGTVTSRFSGPYADEYVWHRAVADLRVVDLGTGQVITSVRKEAKAKKPDLPEKTGRSALEQVGEAVGAELAGATVKALGL